MRLKTPVAKLLFFYSILKWSLRIFLAYSNRAEQIEWTGDGALCARVRKTESGALPKERRVRAGAPPEERRSPFESGERRKVEHSHMYNWLILLLLAITMGVDRLKRFSERDWWQVVEGEVRQAARKVFTAPGLTAGIERAFNLCNISLFEKRQRTTDENFEQMILLKVNLL